MRHGTRRSSRSTRTQLRTADGCRRAWMPALRKVLRACRISRVSGVTWQVPSHGAVSFQKRCTGSVDVVLVAERAQARRAEQEVAPPAGGSPSQRAASTRRMCPLENSEHVARRCRAHPRDHPVGARADVRRRFAAGTAVAKKLPAGPRLRGSRRCACPRSRRNSIRRDRGHRCATAPKPASSHVRFARCSGLVSTSAKRHAAQALAERARVGLAALGQRQVGEAGMLAGQAPGGLAVAGEVDDGQGVAHRGSP